MFVLNLTLVCVSDLKSLTVYVKEFYNCVIMKCQDVISNDILYDYKLLKYFSNEHSS